MNLSIKMTLPSDRFRGYKGTALQFIWKIFPCCCRRSHRAKEIATPQESELAVTAPQPLEVETDPSLRHESHKDSLKLAPSSSMPLEIETNSPLQQKSLKDYWKLALPSSSLLQQEAQKVSWKPLFSATLPPKLETDPSPQYESHKDSLKPARPSSSLVQQEFQNASVKPLFPHSSPPLLQHKSQDDPRTPEALGFQERIRCSYSDVAHYRRHRQAPQSGSSFGMIGQRPVDPVETDPQQLQQESQQDSWKLVVPLSQDSLRCTRIAELRPSSRRSPNLLAPQPGSSFGMVGRGSVDPDGTSACGQRNAAATVAVPGSAEYHRPRKAGHPQPKHGEHVHNREVRWGTDGKLYYVNKPSTRDAKCTKCKRLGHTGNQCGTVVWFRVTANMYAGRSPIPGCTFGVSKRKIAAALNSRPKGNDHVQGAVTVRTNTNGVVDTASGMSRARPTGLAMQSAELTEHYRCKHRHEWDNLTTRLVKPRDEALAKSHDSALSEEDRANATALVDKHEASIQDAYNSHAEWCVEWKERGIMKQRSHRRS